MFKLIFSQTAVDDLADIVSYISSDSDEAAARFATGLLSHVEMLCSFPKLGMVIDQSKGLRSLLHSPIRIYYEVNENRESVEILHFWHVSRRPPFA